MKAAAMLPTFLWAALVCFALFVGLFTGATVTILAYRLAFRREGKRIRQAIKKPWTD